MHEVEVHFSRQITSDVLAGMKLYGNLTAELPAGREETVLSQWRYWFDQNPFAAGFFAVAKDGERVAGFRAIIPVKMRVQGRELLGGKGEFFGVDPDYRRSTVKNSRKTLVMELQAGLREWAYQQGLDAHFGVGTRSATALAMLTGSRLLEFPCDYLSYPFEALSSGRRTGSRVNPLNRVALSVLLPLLRRWSRWRCHRPPGLSLREFADFADMDFEFAGGNEFIAPSAESLTFRFPSDRFVKLAATCGGRARPVAFVFSKPGRGENVRMLYCSAQLKTVNDVLCSAVVEMIARCAAARARKLTLVVPAEESAVSTALQRLGFRRRRGSEGVLLHFANPEYNSELSAARWRFNLSHQRLYQDAHCESV